MVASNAVGLVAVKRFTAAQRREALIKAAIVEFGQRGYSQARTADIARRAGVSQPYVYALFPNKQALFGACVERVAEQIRDSFVQAQVETDEVDALASRVEQLQRQTFETNPDQTLFQLRAMTEPDPAVRTLVRASYIGVVDEGMRLHGAERQQVLGYVARAVLYAISTVLDVPEAYRLDLGHTNHEPTNPT